MRVEKLIDSWTGRSGEVHLKGKATTEQASVVEKEITHPMHSPSIWRQILVLTARTFKVTLRDRMGELVSILEAIFMGVISGLIFLSLDGSLAGIRSRQGALYNAASLQLYLFLIYETYRLSIDMPFFDRERTEGIVTVTSFIVSRRLARMFIEDIPVPLIFSVIFYFMAGFRAETNQFFTFFAVLLILQYIAVSFAILAVSISRNFDGASMFSNIGFLVQSMSCGYLVQANTMPVYMRWSKWASFIVSLVLQFLEDANSCPSITHSVHCVQTNLRVISTVARSLKIQIILHASNTRERLFCNLLEFSRDGNLLP